MIMGCCDKGLLNWRDIPIQISLRFHSLYSNAVFQGYPKPYCKAMLPKVKDRQGGKNASLAQITKMLVRCSCDVRSIMTILFCFSFVALSRPADSESMEQDRREQASHQLTATENIRREQVCLLCQRENGLYLLLALL